MNRLTIRSLFFGAMLCVPASLAQAQSHVYGLNNTYADLFGGPSLSPDGGTLSATGYVFGQNQGLNLSNAFLNGANYSIAFESSLQNLGGFRKQVDFKNRTSDNGFYNLNARPEFFPINQGNVVYAANQMAFTVVTRDAATNLFAYYVNGVQEGSFTDGSGFAIFNATNNIARFFEDDFPTGQNESSPGAVDYIATYDVALTANQVANLGIVTGTPEPASMVLVATGLLGVFGVARRRRIASRDLVA